MNISINDLADLVTRRLRPPPLCIIQARFGSTRLPGKMLLRLGGEALIARAWRIASEAFGADHCVVAIPAEDQAGPLGSELHRIGARVFAFAGGVNDVLGRFHACAHLYRWHPDSVIVRYTPDDPFKTVDGLRRVANGERLPVEIDGEAFTLAQLDAANERERRVCPGAYAGGIVVHPKFPNPSREHITHALFPNSPPPPAPPGCWTVDTEADLIAARERWASERGQPVVDRASWDVERGAVA